MTLKCQFFWELSSVSMGGPAKELPLVYNPNSFPSVSGATTDWFKSGAWPKLDHQSPSNSYLKLELKEEGQPLLGVRGGSAVRCEAGEMVKFFPLRSWCFSDIDMQTEQRWQMERVLWSRLYPCPSCRCVSEFKVLLTKSVSPSLASNPACRPASDNNTGEDERR